MSLWDKWEKEKRKKMGLPVESDVEIHASYEKPKVGNQIVIVAAVIACCIGMIIFSVFIETAYTGKKWSESYIVRLFVSRNSQRESMGGKAAQ